MRRVGVTLLVLAAGCCGVLADRVAPQPAAAGQAKAGAGPREAPGEAEPLPSRAVSGRSRRSFGAGPVADAEPNPCLGEVFESSEKVVDPRRYTGAVFRIEVKEGGFTQATGTGYFIDSHRGWALTAFHVVKPAYNKPGATIRGITDSGTVVTFEIVAYVEAPRDTALLSVGPESLDRVAGGLAFDIALHFHGSNYFTLGYPRRRTTALGQSAEWLGRYEGGDGSFVGTGLQQVRQNVADGSSGSPLFDENGAVIATCVIEEDTTNAAYTPLAAVQELLDQIPPSDRVESLDREIRPPVRPAVQRQLIERLKWKAENPSNLDLYAWAGRIAGNKAAYRASGAYFNCPIVRAYEDRRLTYATSVQKITDLGAPVVRARALLTAADQAIVQGRPDLAYGPSRAAKEIFSASNDQPGWFQAVTLLGRADLFSKRYDAASGWFTQALAQSPGAVEQARARVYLAQASAARGDATGAHRYMQDALPELQRAGDRQGQAVAYETIGAVAATEGKYTLAYENLTRARAMFTETGDGFGVTSASRALAELQAPALVIALDFVKRHWIGLLLTAGTIFAGWFA